MKTNQFRAMMLVLLMAVVSLGVVNAQTLTVTGTVTDVADGTPIVGCSVMLKGTTKGTVTNVNGQYAIQAKKGETLLFQFIGYKQESRVVKSARLDIRMKADEVALEECVVVGYGTRKAKAITSAYMAICPTPAYDMCVNTEEYGSFQENGFKEVADAALSTFSLSLIHISEPTRH